MATATPCITARDCSTLFHERYVSFSEIESRGLKLLTTSKTIIETTKYHFELLKALGKPHEKQSAQDLVLQDIAQQLCSIADLQSNISTYLTALDKELEHIKTALKTLKAFSIDSQQKVSLEDISSYEDPFHTHLKSATLTHREASCSLGEYCKSLLSVFQVYQMKGCLLHYRFKVLSGEPLKEFKACAQEANNLANKLLERDSALSFSSGKESITCEDAEDFEEIPSLRLDDEDFEEISSLHLPEEEGHHIRKVAERKFPNIEAFLTSIATSQEIPFFQMDKILYLLAKDIEAHLDSETFLDDLFRRLPIQHKRKFQMHIRFLFGKVPFITNTYDLMTSLIKRRFDTPSKAIDPKKVMCLQHLAGLGYLLSLSADRHSVSTSIEPVSVCVDAQDYFPLFHARYTAFLSIERQGVELFTLCEETIEVLKYHLELMKELSFPHEKDVVKDHSLLDVAQKTLSYAGIKIRVVSYLKDLALELHSIKLLIEKLKIPLSDAMRVVTVIDLTSYENPIYHHLKLTKFKQPDKPFYAHEYCSILLNVLEGYRLQGVILQEHIKHITASYSFNSTLQEALGFAEAVVHTKPDSRKVWIPCEGLVSLAPSSEFEELVLVSIPQEECHFMQQALKGDFPEIETFLLNVIATEDFLNSDMERVLHLFCKHIQELCNSRTSLDRIQQNLNLTYPKYNQKKFLDHIQFLFGKPPLSATIHSLLVSLKASNFENPLHPEDVNKALCLQHLAGFGYMVFLAIAR